MRSVPPHLTPPDYVTGGEITTDVGPQILTGADLDRARTAGRIAAEVLELTCAAVAPGVTTDQLDVIAHDAFVERGAYPSTLGYRGFTKAVCTSVNDVLCHGIPDDRPLRNGEIVNIDVTGYHDGFHGDTSATVAVGEVSDALQGLVDATRDCTLLGIAEVRPGSTLRDVATAIERRAAWYGYSVVPHFGGHGIGRTFHADPHVHHTARDRWSFPGAQDDRDTVLVPGLTFTVEPMLNVGDTGSSCADDGWTEFTLDGLPSAQFEHTVTVTESGVEILTLTGAGTSPAGALDLETTNG